MPLLADWPTPVQRQTPSWWRRPAEGREPRRYVTYYTPWLKQQQHVPTPCISGTQLTRTGQGHGRLRKLNALVCVLSLRVTCLGIPNEETFTLDFQFQEAGAAFSHVHGSVSHNHPKTHTCSNVSASDSSWCWQMAWLSLPRQVKLSTAVRRLEAAMMLTLLRGTGRKQMGYTRARPSHSVP